MKIKTEKNRKGIRRTGIILMACFVVFLLAAQNQSKAAINKQISYQGKLTNASDVAVADGTYNMVIRIYDSASGGSCLWSARGNCSSPTARSVQVTNGIFSIMLGDTNSGDNSLNLDFNSTYYFGIKVGSDSEMTPRKIIGSAASAFNSDLLDGLDSKTTGADAHIVATDSLGNLTVSGNTYFANGTTYKVDANGNATLKDLVLSGSVAINGGGITSTGALGFTPASGYNVNFGLSGVSAFSVNTNQFYVDTTTGNVGIGTSSPSTKMHLSGSTDGPQTLTIENSNAAALGASANMRVLADAASTYLIAHGSGRTVQRYGLTLGGYSELLTNVGNGMIIGNSIAKPLIFGTNNLERMRVDENGNVGIGTVSPTNLLTVSSNSTSATIFRLENLDTGGHAWTFRSNGSVAAGGAGALKIDDTTAGATRLIIDTNGNVGVGTISPIVKLDVDGDTLVRSGLQVGGSTLIKSDLNDATINFNSSAAPLYAGMTYAPQEGGVYYNSGRYFLMFDTTNNASYPFLTNRTPNGAIVIKTGTAAGGGENEHFRINGGDGIVNAYFTNANLGIGTNNPQSRLQIIGPSQDATTYGIMSFDTNSGVNDMGVKIGALAGAGSAGYAFIQSKHTGIGNDGNLILNPGGGNIGIGTTTPTAFLGLSGDAARTIQMERTAVSNTAGYSLTLKAGGATSGATNKNGGDLILSSGISTGTGTSNMYFQTATGGSVSSVSIAASGSGYSINDVLTIGGWPQGNATVRVTSVSGGAVTGVAILNTGGGYSISTYPTTYGGAGTGCMINVTAISSGDSTPDTKMAIFGNGQVAIGTLTPPSGIRFTVQTSLGPAVNLISTYQSNSGGGTGVIAYSNDGAAMASGDRLGYFILGGARDNAGTLANTTAIQSFAADNWSATSVGSYMTLETSSITNSTRAERMRINPSGNVGVGIGTGLSRFTVKGAASFTPAGTNFSVTSGQATISGTGTWFTHQIGIGDRITINGETKTITAVNSDTSLTVDSSWSGSYSGSVATNYPSLFRVDDSNGITKLSMDDYGRIDETGSYATIGSVGYDRFHEINFTVASGGSGINSYPRALAAFLTTSGTTSFGSSSQVVGAQGQVSLAANLNAVDVAGVFGRTTFANNLPTTTSVTGVKGAVQTTSNANAVDVSGVESALNISAGTTLNTTNFYYFRGTNQNFGTISATNFYGLYLPATSGATNNYGVYSAGGNNYFAGNVGIGVVPTSKLHIVDSATGTTSVEQIYSGTSTLRYTLNANGASAWYLSTGVAEVGKITTGTPGGNPGLTFYTGATYDQNRFDFANAGSYAGFGFSGSPMGLYITKANSFVGIGTASAVANLHISDGNAIHSNLFSAATTNKISLISNQGATVSNYIAMTANNSGAGYRGAFYGIRAGGTLGSPTVPAVNDNVVSLIGGVYDGTTVLNTGLIHMTVDGAVSAGVAPQRMEFVTTPDTMANRATRMVILSGGNVGIGTTTPSTIFHIAKDTSNGGSVQFIDGFTGSTTNGANISIRTSRGTSTAMLRTQSNDLLGMLNFRGAYAANDVSAATFEAGRTAGLTAIATESHTSTAQGSAIFFETTPNGTSTPLERMRIDQNGFVGIGTATPANPIDVVSNLGVGIAATAYTGDAGGSLPNSRPLMNLSRARGTSSAPLVLMTNDKVGTLGFNGYDGSAFQTAALVEAFVDGSISSGSVPMRLSLVTGTSGSNRAERLVVKSDGNVGIGTVTPLAKMHVVDSTGDTIPPSDRGVVIGLHNNGVHTPALQFRKSRGTEALPLALNANDYIGGIQTFGYDGSAYTRTAGLYFFLDGATNSVSHTVPAAFSIHTGTTSPAERFRITSAGYTGIGTTNPLGELHVATNSTSNVWRGVTSSIHSDTATAGNFILMKSRGTNASPTSVQNGDNVGNLAFSSYVASTGADTSDYKTRALIQSSVDGAINSATNPITVPMNLKFVTGASAGLERMRITSGGLVGIATTTPVSPLTVYSTITNGIRGITSMQENDGAHGAAVDFVKKRATGALQIGDQIGASTYWAANNLIASDQMGMGLSDKYDRPAAIRALIDGNLTSTDTPAALVFMTGSGVIGGTTYPMNERLRIASNGNIGIGTTNPLSQFNIVSEATVSSRGISIDQYSNNAASAMMAFKKARGTIASPLIVSNGDYTGGFTFNNYTGSGTTFLPNAGVAAYVNGTVTASSIPTDIMFYTAAAGTTNAVADGVVRMSITSGGNVGIATTAPGYALDVQHASLKVNSKNGYLTNGADYAEYFYTNDTDLKSGEVVCVDLEKENAIKRCKSSGDNNVMGIVSTNPSIVGNGNGKERDNDPHYKIIGMLGQVPANVSSENGEIKIGDSLTAASISGYLRKANAGESTVGVALQNFSGEKGNAKVLISRRNKSLTVEKVEESVSQRIAEMDIEDKINVLVSGANQALTDQMNAKFAEMENLSIRLQQQMEELRKMTNQDLLMAKVDLNAQDIEYLKLVLGIDVDKPGDVSIGGILAADSIETGVLTIKVKDEKKRTTGTNYIAPIAIDVDEDGIDDENGNDGKSYVIKTGAITGNSKVYLTPLSSTKNQVLFVGKVEPGESFEVKVDSPVTEKVRFNWLIVEEQQEF